MANKMGYKASLRWILKNDDTDFLHDEEPIPNVTLLLVADQFGKTDEQALKDLRRMWEKGEN